jgi:hypothetical protein
MFRKIHFIFLGCVFAISCNFSGNSVSRLWFYTYSDILRGGDTTLNPTSFISLLKDGTYTLDFGTFDYGTWEYKNKKLLLRSYKNENVIFPVASVSGNEMQLKSNDKQISHFESQPSSFETTAENPFIKENNLWRIAAGKKESDVEIKSRLLNHLRFWELYFKWALQNNIQSIDVRSMPTLIKIYGNGITIKPYNTLPQKWMLYFYDEEDCRKANGMMEDVFRNENIAWPHTDNKYKAFISVFQQLQQKVKAI